MLYATSVDKIEKQDVSIKSAGHEKICVSVYLSALINGCMLKPSTIFGNVKK